MKALALGLVVLLLSIPIGVLAQRPDTVFTEHLTVDEIRDLIKGGAKNVIVATGGMEDNGPQMVLGAQNYIVTYTAEKIARVLGNTLVAPVIAYVPEGSWNPPSGHLTRPGSISLPDDKGFPELVEAAITSVKGAGFKNIILIGESAGSQSGLKAVADKLDAAWKSTGVRVLFIADYHTKARADQDKYVMQKMAIPQDKLGNHANIVGTSELMFVNNASVRWNRLEPGDSKNGISGDPTKATPQLGEALLKIKIDDAVGQIKQLMATGK